MEKMITYDALVAALPRLKEKLTIEVKHVSCIDHFYSDGSTVGCVALLEIQGYGHFYLKPNGEFLFAYPREPCKSILMKFLQELKDELNSGTT